MSIFDYCCECWAELPGFPEVDEWEHRRCPHCHDEHVNKHEVSPDNPLWRYPDFDDWDTARVRAA